MIDRYCMSRRLSELEEVHSYVAARSIFTVHRKLA